MKKQISKKLLNKIDEVHAKTRLILPNAEEFFQKVQQKMTNVLKTSTPSSTSKPKM